MNDSTHDCLNQDQQLRLLRAYPYCVDLFEHTDTEIQIWLLNYDVNIRHIIPNITPEAQEHVAWLLLQSQDHVESKKTQYW